MRNLASLYRIQKASNIDRHIDFHEGTTVERCGGLHTALTWCILGIGPLPAVLMGELLSAGGQMSTRRGHHRPWKAAGQGAVSKKR